VHDTDRTRPGLPEYADTSCQSASPWNIGLPGITHLFQYTGMAHCPGSMILRTDLARWPGVPDPG